MIADAMQVQEETGNANCTGTVCDNTDPGFNAVGSWKTSSFTPGFLGSNYLHDQNNGKGTKTASWAFTVAANGNVGISARWTSNPNRATSVQYMYSVNGGALQACGVPQDQTISGGVFNTLCTVSVTTGQILTVSVTNDDPSGYVIADAVRVGAVPP